MAIIKHNFKVGSIPTAYGNMRVYVQEDDKGHPVEITAHVGKSGSDVYADMDGVSRIASLALGAKVPIDKIYGQLLGIGGDKPIPHGKGMIKSDPDALGQVLRELYPPEEKK